MEVILHTYMVSHTAYCAVTPCADAWLLQHRYVNVTVTRQ